MNVLNYERIHELIQLRLPVASSLFMPTHRTGREQQQDDIRLKNLVNEARERMLAGADSAGAVDEILQPVLDLRQEPLWRHRSEGLACFCGPDFFRAYRLPFSPQEQVYVGERFHVRPVLPLLGSDARLYILALTQESARLLETTKYSARELALPEVARSEIDGDERPLQYHSHQAPAHGKGTSEAAIFHGHGGPSDRAKSDTLKYFQRVDRAVRRVLRNQRAPLMLACVGFLAPIYQSANGYRNLVQGKVPGSPDRWSDEELRDHAWSFVEPLFQRKQQAAWQTFQQENGKQGASDDLRKIVLAADQGRVDTLFLARGERRWGRVDSQRQTVKLLGDAAEDAPHAQDAEELLDYAAVKTLRNGGDVFMLEALPDTGAAAAATFRY